MKIPRSSVFSLCLGIILGLLLALGACLAWQLLEPRPVTTAAEDLEAAIVLESGLRVPYDATGTYRGSIIRLSPNRQHALYTTWENVHTIIYIANPDGSEVRKLAEQQVPEGSGGLNVDSIMWSDDSQYFTYDEIGLQCLTTCDSPGDLTAVTTTYEVDIASGERTVISVY
jgi:hypothetical protein